MCGFVVVDGKIQDQKTIEDFTHKIKHRGPDHTKSYPIPLDRGLMLFHRLSIMDLTAKAHQPFLSPEKNISLVCNGEIYNYRNLKTDYLDTYAFQSQSDCEVIIPLYQNIGLQKTCENLDGEFAFVIFDHTKNQFLAARDPLGIRPLFYGYKKGTQDICFASEVKSLKDFCEHVKPFPPGHYFQDGKFKKYIDFNITKSFSTDSLEEATKKIREYLIKAVEKRLDSDAPLGFLLSGGLDSSLVCAIATKILKRPITTFAVGITDRPIDTKYAQIVSHFLKTNHHEYLFTKEEAIKALPELIYHLETWDITTIRAALGMYLICKYVKEKTDIKVLLTGEVSDELFGYKYTDYAPSAHEFQKEAIKRIQEIYMYDVLRADRCISSHGLEARVPFSDKTFVNYVMHIKPELKMNHTGVGKYLLRKAFEDLDLLPQDILYRDKAAFSDAVGHSLVDWLQEYAEKKYSDADFTSRCQRYEHATPFTKESLLYRDIFESYYPGQSKLIKDFWMPNKNWKECDVQDPSARILKNYGKSGE